MPAHPSMALGAGESLCNFAELRANQVAIDRERVEEDLREVVQGDLLFDELSRALYSTDASIFQVEPLGVVVPRDEADVQAVVRYALEHQLSVTARGAGSGMAGESLGAGIILDFSRYFRSILEVSGETVRVQPGVVYRDLQSALAREGRRFAPDTGSGNQCTIGGMIANNSSGARAMKHGYTRDHVAELRVVLDSGEACSVAREAPAADEDSRKQAIVRSAARLLHEHRDIIASCQPKTRFNRCGYLLHDVWSDDRLDLARMLVGSEGTLALVTEATLRTIPLPAERGMALLGFASLDAAATAVRECIPAFPSACELLDRRLLSLTTRHYPEYQSLVTPATQAVLLVEFEAEKPGKAGRAAHRLVRLLQNHPDLTTSRVATREQDIEWLWRLRNLALPMLHSLTGKTQPIPIIEDVGVPVEHLPAYLHRVQDILQKHQTTGSFLIHAGAGQVHTRPFLDLSDPETAKRLPALADEIHQWALDLGGTVSTQHAVGLARAPWVAQQYGRLFQVFKELKTIFDPMNVFNPGKILGGDAGALPERMRSRGSPPAEAPVRLRWPAGEVLAQSRACNGCGACRTETASDRMCPLFRVEHTEAATPRAKANLLRSLLDGTLPLEQIGSDQVREVADLCINCKMCAIECPAHVPIPKLMLEAKARHAAENGLSRANWVLARTEEFASFGSLFSGVINLFLRSRIVRTVLERVFGIAARRRLPPFAPRSFLSLAARRGWTHPPSRKSGLKVAYFVDTYANYNDPQLAASVVRVLHHHGIEVFVPKGQVGCGIAPLVCGDVETARRMAERNVRVFADLARAGYTIVCSEPTAAIMLTQDYLDLVDDPDVKRIADQTRELDSFLWERQQHGGLRNDLEPLELSVGHHVPCHVRALQKGVDGPRLLGLIPRMRVHTIDVSCSGMAGTFGLKSENLDASLQAGEPMLARMRRGDIHFGSSECSACRMQIEHGAGKRSLHPVQFLALAYGLMPELARRLEEPIRELVLR